MHELFLDNSRTIALIQERVAQACAKLGQVSAETRSEEDLSEVRNQLDQLAKVIDGFQQHEKETRARKTSGHLSELLDGVDNILPDVWRLIHRIEGLNGSPGFFRRARLALVGFEKQAKECCTALEELRCLLQLSLDKAVTEIRNWTQLRKLLLPSTVNVIPKKLEGTGEWIWSNRKFEHWVTRRTMNPALAEFTEVADESDVDNRVLLIHGIRGCGKSVLAASIDCELQKKHKISIFFSFSEVHGQERRTDSMLRSLLWQLILHLPEEEQNDHIMRLLEEQSKLKNPAYIALEIHKLDVIQQYDVFFILDGIEESTDNWNDTEGGPLGILIRLLQSNRKMHLLLIGRQRHLRTALLLWTLQLEMTRDLINDDISKLIAHELDNSPNITDGALRESIRRELEYKPAMTFLRIGFIFNQLRSSALPEIDPTLRDLPYELGREYNRLFSKLTKRFDGDSARSSANLERSKTLLSLIIASFRPLTSTELCLAYTMTFPSASPTSACSETLISKEDIMKTCGELISINKGRISLLHTSIREFLFRTSSQWDRRDTSIAHFRLEPKPCHRMLGMACLRYLQQINWQDSNWAESPGLLSSRYPFFSYASYHVSSHLLESDMTAKDSDEVIDFCSSKGFREWREFILLHKGTDTQNEPLPIHFWDDFTDFWGAFQGFGY